MKKIAVVVLILFLMTAAPVFAGEKSVVVEDWIAKTVIDDEFIPVEEAYFYGLRHVCETFNYDVKWDSGHGYAIVTQGEGKTLTDENGNDIDALVIRPGVNSIEMHDGDIGKLDELLVEYKPFIDGNRLYVHSSVFAKYFGLETVD